MAKLLRNQYGKSRVRFLKVIRHDERHHDVCEIEADVLLRGELEGSYFADDNSSIVPTDTVKNTLHILAHDHLGTCRTTFALVVASHFLEKYPHLTGATVELRERRWKRMFQNGVAQPHSFLHEANGAPFTRAALERGFPEIISSGIRNQLVMKTTASAFTGYNVCDLTTLPPTDDRILSTRLSAEWFFEETPADYRLADERILGALHGVFADHHSPSVQRTLFEMGEAALAVVPEISRIHLALPNVHFLNLDLSKLGRPGQNVVFLPTDEPHGQIEATVGRG